MSKLKLIMVAILFAGVLTIFFPAPVQAMHISEGILPLEWAVAWYVIAFPFVYIGIRQISSRTKSDKRLLPLMALMGAVAFLISCFPIPVPIAGTCSHPCGTPLAAILVGGPFISSVLGAIALLLQALFLAHGGISSWGANILSMAVAGSFVGFGVFILLKKLNVSIFVAGFAAGLLGDWATYVVTAFQLALALHGDGSLWGMWGANIVAFMPAQLPLGILEGIFTGGVVTFVAQRRPQILAYLMPGVPAPLMKTGGETG